MSVHLAECWHREHEWLSLYTAVRPHDSKAVRANYPDCKVTSVMMRDE
jgi:hypothetical protein